MKILKIYPNRDIPTRYNYHINYGAWDEIIGDRDSLENFSSNLDNYDMVFIPMYVRWTGYERLLQKIKEHKVKTILFDNDTCYREFTNKFYDGFDYIFYRDLDILRNEHPTIPCSRLLWSVDTDLYTPKFGGSGISFNCTIGKTYEFRNEIAKVIKRTNYNGQTYINHLQNSAGAIHVNSKILSMVRAKILEFASCGTQIISNPSDYMELYFPTELIIEFKTIIELQNIIKEFVPDIKIQQELRNIVVETHTNKIRATQILKKLEDL